ncbi:Thiamin diphosphate-binding protein [Gloeophyllum trabeum ATCC 11539]|uniref:Thiamin diphosphate-binding protein n=1 Tax=Gloeophyllum trabeum (strain ATCC 11539 / FP-39264 / Madison 617) TaxID=670483 RepID=S7Q604_GLOTA|nr:thiamine diphosphate-binding protein [Gloeophyllum trabeum ATCC 11539]EPQ54893.1 Thiamin diphosphate-binding protein [Gloeophyllum trabeum ATCC 11539]
MPTYTGASVFLQTLARGGVKYAFVNWGSDHPAFLEDLERQRQTNKHPDGDTEPSIVICPNEMVGLSAAQGYASVTGKPAAVIVHVDVGTQALAGAVHNVDRARAPVLIYAGASAHSADGELMGSRNEFVMWLQDVPDQPAIVRQYMRYTGQINSAKNVDKMVMRALQIAQSEPRGPVYLWARREVTEEVVEESLMNRSPQISKWPIVLPCALPPAAVATISSALLSAQFPLIITGHLSRNSPSAIDPLLELSELLSIPLFAHCPSTTNIPYSHPHFAGLSFGYDPFVLLKRADVVLIIDCDIPFIEVKGNKPPDTARVFVIDGGDVLRTTMNYWHVDAEIMARSDGALALSQLVSEVKRLDAERVQSGKLGILGGDVVKVRGQDVKDWHNALIKKLDDAESTLPALSSQAFSAPNVLGTLRKTLMAQDLHRDTLVFNEGISNYVEVFNHLRPDAPVSYPGGGMAMLAPGAGALGWALGNAIGACIGERDVRKQGGRGYKCVVAVMGDGCYLFGVPGSAYWIARRYETPFLTIILNNGGWKSPKVAMLGVYPNGLGSSVHGDRLTVGFGPSVPDYSQIAVAASSGWVYGRKVERRDELEEAIREAVRVVVEEKRTDSTPPAMIVDPIIYHNAASGHASRLLLNEFEYLPPALLVQPAEAIGGSEIASDIPRDCI